MKCIGAGCLAAGRRFLAISRLRFFLTSSCGGISVLFVEVSSSAKDAESLMQTGIQGKRKFASTLPSAEIAKAFASWYRKAKYS